MGRRKIEIKKLEDTRNRNATFEKRRQGILKKAHELAIDSKVTLSISNKDSVEDHVFNNITLTLIQITLHLRHHILLPLSPLLHVVFLTLIFLLPPLLLLTLVLLLWQRRTISLQHYIMMR